MKRILVITTVLAAGLFCAPCLVAQNVGLNLLVLNSGLVPLGGKGTLNATVNATPGSGGQNGPVATGKINVSITVPPSLLISATQSNLPAGWIVRNNDGVVINLCNSTATLAVNTSIDLPIELEGLIITSGAPTMSGQISFRTNCNAPGSLSGDNLADNSSQAGFTVTTTTPVTLSNFVASLINCQPSLNWTTETEVNSSRFEIERTNGQFRSWVSVGTVNAKGNSSLKIKYSFTDKSTGLSEKVFYRLKMIDKDGKYRYSETLPVVADCKTASLTVFPNPAQKGRLYVSATGLGSNAEASLLTLSGQAVLKTNLFNGTNSIDVSKMSAGVYLLNVDFGNGNSTRTKVIVQQ
jgi:hypothetical protein